MSSLVIDRTRFVYGPTDQPTERPTDICKEAIYPLFFEGGGGHKYGMNSFLLKLEPKVIIHCHQYRGIKIIIFQAGEADTNFFIQKKNPNKNVIS